MKQSQNTAGVIPDAAFGPPGKKDARGLTPQGTDTNISIVISKIGSDLTLNKIGAICANGHCVECRSSSDCNGNNMGCNSKYECTPWTDFDNRSGYR